MKKQVDISHYAFSRYLTKKRWASSWHQLDEVMRFKPRNVVEIGPGPGVFKAVAATLGVTVTTVDIDPDLHPDVISDATQLPFNDGSCDVTCAFQVLEHMPFETSLQALREMARVARKGIVISLPDVKGAWPFTFTIPKIGQFEFQLTRPFHSPPEHVFNGQHHWEIEKRGYEAARVFPLLRAAAGGGTMRTFRVHEFPYHRFLVFER